MRRGIFLYTILSVATMHASYNVDPFFSERTVSKPQAYHAHTPNAGFTSPSSLAFPPNRPPILPQRPPAKPSHNYGNYVKPSAAVAVAGWSYYDTVFLRFAVIGATAACIAYLYWLYTKPEKEPLVVLHTVCDDADIFFKACCNNDVSTVCQLLDANKVLLERVNKDGATPLIAACSKGSYAVVLTLLHYGVDVNTVMPSGATALKIAAAHGHVEIVRALIEQGAYLEAFGQSRFSPLMVAVWHGQLEVVKLLVHAGARIDARVDLSSLDIARGVLTMNLTAREREAYNGIVRELNR